jgi:1-acyl-sn-glycerol-3-phosphate acyltransferase
MPYPIARFTTLPLLRLRLKDISGAENLPQRVPFILAANHGSWMDSPYLVAAIAKYVKRKIYFIAASGKHKWLGGLPINPNNRSEVLERCSKKIKAGNLMVIFPEGNSNPSKTMRKGKTGAVRLALSTKTMIVPIGITGTHAYGACRALLRFCTFWLPIKINIGQPIDYSAYFDHDVDYKTLRKLTDNLMAKISLLSDKPLANDN